jgi:hypothetical protein
LRSERWTCQRCGSANQGAAVACGECGLMRETASWGGSTTSADASASPEPEPAGGGTPPVGLPAPVPAESSGGGFRWTSLLRFAWIGIAAVVVLGGWYFAAGRDDAGQITDAGSLASTELRVGDCFDLQDPSADMVEDVDAKPCSETHEFEVFLAGSLADGGFPGEPAFDEYAFDNCLPAFEELIGVPYEESELDIFYLVPTRDSWSDGDHEVSCAVYDPLQEELTGSLRGANR